MVVKNKKLRPTLRKKKVLLLLYIYGLGIMIVGHVIYIYGPGLMIVEHAISVSVCMVVVGWVGGGGKKR